MNWRRSLIIFINLLCIAFPYNILGCGDSIDPDDYYTSFFQNDLAADKAFHPFYYTNYQFLYNATEPVDAAEATSSEWITYCGGKMEKKQAYDFVCRFAYKDLSSLYYHLEKNQPLKVADSIKDNPVTGYFLNTKDLEALGYLMYAKQVEPFVLGNWNDWEPPLRDSLKMTRLIKNGLQLHAAARKDFIRLRYAYQVLRLAHYSGHYQDCIRYYEELVKPNTVTSVLQGLCTSLKAGALFQTGQKVQAAYLFSQQFAATDVKKIANYMSFHRCTRDMTDSERKQCIAISMGNEEKANLAGLFALGSTGTERETIKTISQLSPAASILEVLAVREVNKIEENYLSPLLAKEEGGRKLFYTWVEEKAGNNLSLWMKEAKELATLFHSLAGNNGVKNPALFETCAAYLAYITRNYPQARQYISAAENMKPSSVLKDQLALTSLLVTLNEKDNIDAAFEVQLLPSLQWLEAKALREKTSPDEPVIMDQWQKFYRNVFTDVLAKRYHRQGEIHKEALCIGKAFFYNEYPTREFVQNDMDTKHLMTLDALLHSARKNKWEQFICNRFPMKNDEVTDVIAMTHIRDYNFPTALEWMAKIKDVAVLKLERNPFGDLPFDNQDSTFAFDNDSYDKALFIREMNALNEKEKQGKATAADLYKLATGYYNMTYYGRAWQLVKYYRSGADGYFIPKNANVFEKEYYGCFTAEQYYKKAMNATGDANVKARCLFMMAKCAQKQVPKPQYEDYPGNHHAFELAEKRYIPAFKNNKYFPDLIKDYRQTSFYKEVLNTCSYLKDFVVKQPNK